MPTEEIVTVPCTRNSDYPYLSTLKGPLLSTQEEDLKPARLQRELTRDDYAPKQIVSRQVQARPH